MKLRFKHQKFQADAAKAVVDVFAGQPYLTPSYMTEAWSLLRSFFIMNRTLPVGAIKKLCRN